MPAGGTLQRGTRGDAGEVLVLQRCCWVSEAVANERFDLPALSEGLDDVRRWGEQSWLLRDRGRLIGAVRATADGTVWRIGRLMVAPDRQREGLGRRLLAHVEAAAPEGITRFALFTGRRSARNLDLYERAGYTRVATRDDVVHLEKQREPTRPSP